MILVLFMFELQLLSGFRARSLPVSIMFTDRALLVIYFFSLLTLPPSTVFCIFPPFSSFPLFYSFVPSSQIFRLVGSVVFFSDVRQVSSVNCCVLSGQACSSASGCCVISH